MKTVLIIIGLILFLSCVGVFYCCVKIGKEADEWYEDHFEEENDSLLNKETKESITHARDKARTSL